MKVAEPKGLTVLSFSVTGKAVTEKAEEEKDGEMSSSAQPGARSLDIAGHSQRTPPVLCTEEDHTVPW